METSWFFLIPGNVNRYFTFHSCRTIFYFGNIFGTLNVNKIYVEYLIIITNSEYAFSNLGLRFAESAALFYTPENRSQNLVRYTEFLRDSSSNLVLR